MDNYNRKEEGIFNLSVNERGKAFMLETARWAKFLAIIGLIITGILLVGMVFLIFGASEISKQLGAVYGAGYGIGMFFFYLLVLLIVLYPSITLLKFANKLRPAVSTGNEDLFNEALRSLKNTFKFWGIYVIILLSIYGISIIFLLIGAAVAGF
jgi:hypothetical protein